MKNIEGTVLQFLVYTIKQDQELAKEYLKLAALPTFTWSIFGIAVLFIIARLPNFSQKVYKMLYDQIIAAHEDSTRIVLFNDKISKGIDKVAQIFNAIKRGASSWEFTIQSMLDFALYLLDHKKPVLKNGLLNSVKQ